MVKSDIPTMEPTFMLYLYSMTLPSLTSGSENLTTERFSESFSVKMFCFGIGVLTSLPFTML